MKVKRGLVALAGVILLGSTIAACGSDSTDGESNAGKTLNVLVQANSIYPTQQKQWFTDVSEKFKKETGASVAFETFASPNDELTKIQTSVLSGQGPDVYSLGTTFTPTAYATKAFVELTADDWSKLGGRDKFLPATLGISGPDKDHEVGVPFTSRPFVMAYNKDLLTAAGIDKPADSWDGLLTQAKSLTKGGTFGLAVAYGDSFDPWKFIWAMNTQAGNQLVKDGKAQLDQPATLKAYQTYLGWLATDKVVDPAAAGWKNAQAIAAFGAGKAAFLPMVSATSKVTLDKSAVAGKYAYAIMPTIPPGESALPSGGQGATSILSGDNLVVAKYTKNKDLALSLVKMLTSADSQAAYYKTFGEMPTNAEAARTLQSDPALAAIIDSSSKAVGTPFSGAWSQVQLALVNVVVQSVPNLAAGKVDEAALKALLATAQTTAQAALDKVK
ncbi:multiple sugar transport system substrate-binding protein [Allocatelliglobosispora scoriae]|uniref:Multiple sugar transport system substrate-binding protein n=1 Tax=Allocatelliglobosispora scoriae TaxID=643052 RepID=A0A841C0S8_9ACTN|nr:extracellular solute-binding protein [Allocatelliglobosispora scoriae]MBB5872662.1 multiple sugar transport system substrate-binding protein [Allocatelliglobosispora scoriae]